MLQSSERERTAVTYQDIRPEFPLPKARGHLTKPHRGSLDGNTLSYAQALQFAEGVQNLLFLHIPKTAGSTFLRILDRQYGEKQSYWLDGHDSEASINQLTMLPESKRNNIRLLSGHMPFGLHTLLQGPHAYVTFLRHPVERLISHYYFVRENPYHYLHAHVVTSGMDLMEYVQSGISPELENGQTKALSGNLGASSSDDLSLAKENLLQHFVAVGLTERFDESILLMRDRLNWKVPFYVSQNVTRNRPLMTDLPRRVIRAVERVNELDYELYEYVAEKHHAAITDRGAEFQAQLRAFQSRNLNYQRMQCARLLPRKVISRLAAFVR